MALLCLLWAALAPNFTNGTNLTLLLQQTSVLMIVAVKQTFVILTGEIDLPGGIDDRAHHRGRRRAHAHHDLPLLVAILVVLAMGVGLGLFTGLLRVVWEIPSFIVTLELLTALQGLAFTISGDVTVSPVPDALSPLWEGSLLGIPTPVWLMVAAVGLGAWVLGQTRYGRHLYAMGGNAEVSRRYGIDVRAMRMSVFVIVQCAAVLGGLLYAAQLESGNATIGRMMELNVIAGVVVGGVALFGGTGRVVGTVRGTCSSPRWRTGSPCWRSPLTST
ncbi:ABC transporter permease [Pseudonocardia sichuanensis]